jgi:hypothetical protein
MTAPQRPAESAQPPFVLIVIERLIEAVESETQALQRPGPIDYRAHSQQKSQALLELSRLEPKLAGVKSQPGTRAALAKLIGRLEENQKLLHARLRAARTIAEVVSRAINEGQSDGTYSSQIWRENRR